MHVRGQIRDAVTELLITVPGLDTDHVFADSDEMLQANELPCACVWLGDEEIEHETLGGTDGATLKRDVVLNIDILHRARRDALIEAEEIAAAIEIAMATSADMLELARSWYPRAIEVFRESGGSLPSVQLRLSWAVTYSTNERDPTVAIS